ncbi:MAG TPA: cytochrome c oxidase assembly protein [Actinomycetota bacterium]
MATQTLSPELGDALGTWAVEPLTVAVLLVIASAYLAGLVRIARAGRGVDRTGVVAFSSGWLVLALALLSPIDVYADVSFSVHMAQHLLLTFVAPVLLAMGAPVTLALGALPARAARVLARAMRSRAVTPLTSPLAGWSLFVGVPVVVHATRLFEWSLGSPGWHALEHGLWIGVALVYWWPIVGADPSPRPVRYGVRLLSLTLVMPAMSFLALAIYTADRPLYPTYAALPSPWGPGALDDQRNAAAMMWIAGNLALVVAMLVVAAMWKRHDDERQRRLEAREDAAISVA